MAAYNKVILLGNVTRDLELRYTPRGTALVDVGLAINRTWKDDAGEKQEEVTFVDVTFWGRSAEILGEYCQKGTGLHVEGRLTLERWEDKGSGKKMQRLKVVGEGFQFLPSAGGGSGGTVKGGVSRSAPAPAPAPAPVAASPAAVGEDDEIPF
jgi:single-strand DNA-binding protein